MLIAQTDGLYRAPFRPGQAHIEWDTFELLAALPTAGMFGKKSTRRPPAVVMVRFADGNAINVVDVISGFQRPDGQRLARPVGIAIGPEGALYFTSDTHTEGLFRLRPTPMRTP